MGTWFSKQSNVGGISRILVILLFALSVTPRMTLAQFSWTTPQPIVISPGYVPHVLHNNTPPYYQMWYAVNTNGGWDVKYAESPDGIAWQAKTGLPVLTRGPKGSFDSKWAIDPYVMKVDSHYVMYYTGHDGTFWRVGMATSPDGITWTKSQNNPIISGTLGWDSIAVMVGAVFPVVSGDSTTYFMIFNGYDGVNRRIGVGTSVDGVTWVREPKPVFGPGDSLAWEGDGVATSTVIQSDQKYYMFYQTSRYDTPLGVAMSYDGRHWTRRDNKPILSGTMTSWTPRLGFGTAILLNDTLKYWYSGDAGTYSQWQIGYLEAAWPDTVKWATDSVCTVTRTTGVAMAGTTPSKFALEQAYPNPFNPTTTISFTAGVPLHVNVTIYDVLGREVATLYDQMAAVGKTVLRWDASRMASGAYFCRVRTDGRAETLRLMLMK